MIYSTKIIMQYGCQYSQNPEEIAKIYLTGCASPGYYSKEDVHNLVKQHPGSVKVAISPYPDLIPAISIRGEKYVRSSPNASGRDNLMALPRE